MDKDISCVGKKIDLSLLNEEELVSLYAKTLAELQRRTVVRSANNLVADLAESLAARLLGGQLTGKSQKGYDIIVEKFGQRLTYQVKARRITGQAGSRQLGSLRELETKGFDYLVGILFNEDFTPRRGAIIPWEIVKQNAGYREHTNSWKFMLRDSVWDLPGVEGLPLRS